MKAVSAVLKLVGFLLLSVAVIGAPLIAAGWNAFPVIDSPQVMRQAVHEYWLSDRTPLIAAGKQIAEEKVRSLPQNDASLWFWRVLDGFNDHQWATLLDYVLPQPILTEIADNLVYQWAGWWLSPDASPRFVANLRPLKKHLNANADKIADWVVAQVGACTLKQNALWARSLLLNDWAHAPLCLPTVGRGKIIGLVASGIRSAKMPAEVNLLEKSGVSPQSLQDFKDKYRRAREDLPLAAAGTFLLWIFGVLLMGRSWRGWLSTAGGSLLSIAGGMALIGFAAVPVEQFTVAHLPLADVPAWAVEALGNTLRLYFKLAFTPLLKQSLIPAAIGVILLIPPIVKR